MTNEPEPTVKETRAGKARLEKPRPARNAAESRIFLSVGQFTNINGGPAFDTAGAALQQALIRGLSQDPEITVRSGQAEAGLNTSGEVRFGSRIRLSGSLQRIGAGMRIDVKLVDVATGDHLWVERYEGETTPEFQTVVVGLIASQVRVNLMLGKFSLRDKASADGPEVRQIVNSAIVNFFRQTPESLAEAITLAERALAIDPTSARAKRTLSAAISASISLGELPRTPETLERALRLAQEAVEAVPQDEIARCELAWALSNLGRHAEAAGHLQVAVDLNPASPNARADLAEQLTTIGRPQEALEQLRLAFATSGSDPLEIWRYHTMAMAHFALGDYADTLDATRHMMEVEPGFVRGALFWAASAAALGQEDEARRAAAHVLTIAPKFRRAEVSPTYLARYVEEEPHARLLEMLERAGLP
jgi:tetratricopeptide (TPR) repeat protein